MMVAVFILAFYLSALAVMFGALLVYYAFKRWLFRFKLERAGRMFARGIAEGIRYR
jgi:hypothetical protein